MGWQSAREAENAKMAGEHMPFCGSFKTFLTFPPSWLNLSMHTGSAHDAAALFLFFDPGGRPFLFLAGAAPSSPATGHSRCPSHLPPTFHRTRRSNVMIQLVKLMPCIHFLSNCSLFISIHFCTCLPGYCTF